MVGRNYEGPAALKPILAVSLDEKFYTVRLSHVATRVEVDNGWVGYFYAPHPPVSHTTIPHFRPISLRW